jgi:hypothetical protein
LLEQKALEAADRQVATLTLQPGQTQAQLEELRTAVRAALALVVRLQTGSEWINGTTIDLLNDEQLPDGIVRIEFDSAFLYRASFNNLVLIFDQFEEIFSFHPELGEQRREFFEQLRDCLAAYPKLGLLLSMREDYLADMDSFAGYLPDRLRTRMRMERLSEKQAHDAIARPAKDAGKPFDAGVAGKLTDDLRRVQTGHKSSAQATSDGHALGKYVEPVQLQIICRQLWSKLPDDATTITGEQVETLARVDDALTNFYRDALRAVREKVPTLCERAVRQWFSEHLITSAKTRGMVYQGESETEKVPNAVVEVLREKYILRADIRPTGTWYDLAHDRLVEPILADNLEWRASYKNPVAGALQRGADNLLTGSALGDALRYAKENSGELNPEEQQFLKKSEIEAKKTKVRRRTAIAITAVVMLALSILTFWAITQQRLARRQANAAHQQAKLAQSSALAAQAGTLLAQDRWEESLDRAIRAFGVADTEEAREAVARVRIRLLRRMGGVEACIGIGGAERGVEESTGSRLG